jgi:hypothetical protein
MNDFSGFIGLKDTIIENSMNEIRNTIMKRAWRPNLKVFMVHLEKTFANVFSNNKAVTIVTPLHQNPVGF